MQRERRRAGRAIRKARREQRERYAALVAHPDFRRQREMLEQATVDFGRIAEGVADAIAHAVDALTVFARALVAEIERSAAPFVAYYRLAVFESEQQAFRDRLAFRALEPLRRVHAEHVTVEAWPLDCIEGECEHVTEEGEGDLDLCAPTNFAACVDCMDEKGAGRDEEGWEDWPLEAWPHPGSSGWTETPPAMADAA